MSENKKAQGMVVDLIMLILIASVFFTIVSSQVSHQSSDAAVIRTKSTQIQRTMIALMDARADNTTSYWNATVGELISENYCGANAFSDINATVQKTMQIINKPDYYFILVSCAEEDCSDSKSFGVCSPEVEKKFGGCCIKTEFINVAKLRLNLPASCSRDFTALELGIWPDSMEVEGC